MEHRIVADILKRNDKLLNRYLVLSPSVIETLYHNNVITDSLRAKLIRSEDKKQVPLVLDSLRFRGLQGFQRFLITLKETGHRWMIDVLLDTKLDYDKLQRGATDISSEDEQTDSERPRPKKRTTFAMDGERRGNLKKDREKKPVAHKKTRDEDKNLVSLDEVMQFVATRPNMQRHLARGNIKTQNLFDSSIQDPLAQSRKTYPSESHGNVVNEIQEITKFFDVEQSTYDQSMSVLRQEEVLIGELLEQNRREQNNVLQNQSALEDIKMRLRQIHNTATTLYNPKPDAHVTRERLTKLNHVPWTKHY